MKGPLRILVAEDNEDDFAMLVRALQKGGYELAATRVESAASLSAALQQESWDVIFSDWAMPQFSALDALRVVQEAGVDAPFIIVSGTIGEDVAVEALRAGAHDFLVKDRPARLIPAVDRELREAKIRRERNKMQEQLMISERMASVGLLAAGVAHEINNPLASLMVNLELATRELAEAARAAGGGQSSRDLREELSDARAAAERIRDIVRDLKLFSRADDLKRGTIEVQRVLDSSLRMAWNEIRHRARLVKDYNPVPLVEANESRLGQVFLNLIVNAAQSIPEGRADHNEIAVTTGTDSSGRVLVEIRDSGGGIPPDVLKRLFTPFFTTKPVGVGTGLGLSICHGIVTALGGDISVESVVGAGSTFRVHLPAAQEGATQAATEDPRGEGKPHRRGKVLVVDDEPMILAVVRRTLAQHHDVVATPHAQEALAKVNAGDRFDVILCDLMMPEMTGMDLHSELCRAAPDQAERMIFLTGGTFTGRAVTFLDQVPNRRVEKPFDTAALCAIVNERVK